MDNVSIKKLHVCVEDHSVWLLTDEGVVYSKAPTDPDFTVYPITSDLIVTGITGFNAKEMYFVVGKQVLGVIDGVKGLIEVPFEGVTRINDISVAYGRFGINAYNDLLSRKDYLSVATNKNLSFLLRGENQITIPHIPSNFERVDEPDYRISYAGFKYIEYNHIFPGENCDLPSIRTTENFTNSFNLGYTFPDTAPFPSKINATVSSLYLKSPFWGQDYGNTYFNIWATDHGIYVRDILSICANSDIRNYLSGEIVNALENTYALTPIYKQDFVLAGANSGIFYTKRSVFSNDYGPLSLDSVEFVRLNDFPRLKVNAIKNETDILEVIVNSNYRYNSVCEKISWVATESGVYKLYLKLEQEYFDQMEFRDLSFDKMPLNLNYANPVFQLCAGEDLTVRAAQPESFGSQLLFEWFKDGTELPELKGKLKATLGEPGVYTINLTSLCDRITVKSMPIIIYKAAIPEIDFSYPEQMDICSGESFFMKTKAVTGYTYKWYKNDVEIPGAESNVYTADTEGTYHVGVSNCSSGFVLSSKVNLKVIALSAVTITPNKPSYCEDEEAILSFNNPEHLKIKWFLNGVEEPKYADQEQIHVREAGVYIARLYNDLGCSTDAAPYQLTFQTLPIPIITADRAAFCTGEQIKLKVNNVENLKIKWYIDGLENSSFENLSEIIALNSGAYIAAFSNVTACSKSSNPFNLIIYTASVVTIQKDLISRLCEPDQFKLTALCDDGVSYKWSNGATTPSIDVGTSGRYSVLIKNQHGCETLSDPIEVIVTEGLKLDQPIEVAICVATNQKIKLEAKSGFKYYSWNGNKGSSNFFMISQPGIYRLEIEDDKGCKQSVSYNVLPKCNTITIPNAFSPNDDGINDVWLVTGLDDEADVQINIFNRYGAKVFSTNAKKPYWDGSTGNGRVPVGTYYFVLVTSSNKRLTGSITLLK